LQDIGLHIGTSGWSYKHWRDIFYPADVKPTGYLEYYLKTFACVELNSSFYHLPQKTTVEGWMHRTPSTFRFCPKLSRFITHRKRLAGCGEALEQFFGVLDGMRPRLGPVLIQLPPGLAFDEPLVSDFLDLLKNRYSGYRYAIEVRHRSWLTDGFFHLLRQNRVAFVIADSGKRYPHHEIITSDFTYLRFHGPENLYASEYDDPALQQYAEKIKGWLGKDLETWVFFNNDFHGFAIKNALTLNQMIHSP
jgi:uncharacterized protein YecE (DUF72 family)